MRYYFLLTLLCVGFSITAQNDQPIIKADEFFGDLRARHIGPALMSGRVSDIAGHPTNENVLLVGAAGGGVWQSVDAGVTFSPIFDEHIQSIGAVAFDPTNPNEVLWVGTGECWVRNSVTVGNGIYKSTDGGKNWKNKGLEKSERISSVIVHPANGNIVYAGVLGNLWGESNDRGVYKSEDGGESWSQILSVDGNTGCADLAMDPKNPDVLYASMWEFRRTAYSFSSGGEKSALYKSIDGGKSWDKIHKGLPAGRLGRIGVAMAPSQPEILYAVVECEKDEEKGLYKSTNGGESWAQTNNDFELTVRPFYFSRIVVHPTNPDFICKGGLNGSISEDGGKTFRQISSGVHSDIHDFWFDIKDPNKIVLGTDGGVYRSWDKGHVWEMVKGLPLSQYYHLALDNATPYNIYGGLQDNGSWIGPSQKPGGISSRHWQRVGYGDGFRVYPHPSKPNFIYSEMQGAENIWLIDTKYENVKIVKPYPTDNDIKLRFNWNAPITTSPHHDDRFYVGSQFVHRSEDMGNTWTIISPDLTTNDKSKQEQENSGGLSKDNSGAENHCTIFTISESPLDENIIWAGTDDGQVQVTMDGGEKWTNVTANLQGVPKNTWTYHIEPSNHQKLTAYAVFDGHTQNDRMPYVQKTTDGGKTWVSIATDQIEGFVRSIQEDFVNPNLLFLGTEYGLYITLDGGQYWSHFTKNMPPVAVHHLELHPRENDLVMATHGRGIIILDDISTLRQVTPEILEEPLHFFETGPSVQYKNGAFGGYAETGEFVGENPTRNAVIPYSLNKRHVFGKMSITVHDENGRKISDLNPGKSKGINLVEWNFSYPLPKIAKGKTLAFGGFAAPSVPPGKYEVRINKGKESYSKTIEVVADPNSPHSLEDLKAQHEAAMRLYDLNEQLAFMVHQIDAFEIGLDGTVEGKAETKIEKEAVALRKQFELLKERLVVLTGDNYVGSAEPELREKLVSLYSDVLSYAGRPSASQLQRLNGLNDTFQTKMEEHTTLIKQLDKLNKALKAAGKIEIKLPDANAFFDQKA